VTTVPAPGQPQPYETGGDARAGALLFARKGCATCHAEGATAVGPSLSTSPAVSTPLALATAMWNHAPAMYDQTRVERVEWPRFEGEEMRDLSAYLQQARGRARRGP
jgi:mono/diheme cytochrome c family protein